MQKLKVKREFPYDKIGSFKYANPYTILFVYPRREEPYIIKGGLEDSMRYLAQVLKGPALIRHTYWHHGRSRGSWRTVGLENVYFRMTFIKDNIKKYGRPYVVLDKKGNVIKRLRRIPRKWMKELDDYIWKPQTE